MHQQIENLTLTLGHELLDHGWFLATAESCTGGGLAAAITGIAGSSTWFDRGFVTYSNDAKIEMLKVSPILLEQYGAVSSQTAAAMARGALDQSKASISIAITGIAGPSGGTIEKPVGTVWFGFANILQSEPLCIVQHFEGDREQIRQSSILFALEKIIFLLRSLR